MIKPRPLKPGDTLGVVAPAGPVDATSLAEGVRQLEAWGFRVRLGAHVHAAKEYLAGSDADRLADLDAMLRDPSVRGILAARGGYGTMRLLPHLDWEPFLVDPKPFVGYSDLTALHALLNRLGLVSFHGTMVAKLGSEYSREALRRALTTPGPLGEIPLPEGMTPFPLKGGVAEGVLVGGNLALLCALLGTPYQLETGDRILLIEEVNEPPYRADRLLTQLRLSGALDGVRGILVGTPDFDEYPEPGREGDLHPWHRKWHRLLADRLGDLGIPILADFPCGHTPDRATLPLGVRVRLDADGGRLTVLESAFAGD